MAREKTPVILLEELTTEEKIEKAEQYVVMADNMLMYQWKTRYYNKAMKLLKTMFDEVPTLKDRYHEIRVKRSTVLAEGYITDYQEACRLRAEATNEDQMRIAIRHFETLAEFQAKHEIRVSLIDKELADRLASCMDAAEQARVTQEAMDKKRGRKVRINMAILVVLALLCVGGLLFKKTPYYDYTVGWAESMLGQNTRAWARYKKAYRRTKREDWKQVYLETRYADGVAAYESGDYETAYSDFKTMAVEDDYLDSEEYFVKTEKAIIRGASIRDVVKFGGIEWYVLDQEADRYLLIKKSSCGDYSYATQDTKWENFTGRQWLNETFLQDSFMEKEIEAICTVEVPTSVNPDYGGDSGAPTQDRIFILSVEDVEKYGSIMKNTRKMSWLRTPGAVEGSLCVLSPERKVMTYGYLPEEETIHIRPVMWVNVGE